MSSLLSRRFRLGWIPFYYEKFESLRRPGPLGFFPFEPSFKMSALVVLRRRGVW